MVYTLSVKGLCPNTGTLVNSENPDEMLQNVVFHQGLHWLLS